MNLLETFAFMRTIVRRDTNEDRKQCVVRLIKEEGAIDDEDEPIDAKSR